MKTKLLLSALLSFYFCLLSSQVPQGFNYQAIARDGSGNAITGATMQVKIGILSDTIANTMVWEELFNPVRTNGYGMFTVIVGTGVKQTGSAASFSVIDWTKTPLFLRTSIYYTNSWKVMGTSKLQSVPYSMVAANLEGTVPLLSVKGNTTIMDSALFVVRNNTGQIVFAVYNEGVRIYVDDGKTKGSTKGGFAIGSFDKSKGISQPLFVVDPDSIRAYLDNNPVKTVKGGFAIGGFDRSKSANQNFLMVSKDSIRMYIDDNLLTKSTKGGFAIGSFDKSKGGNISYLNVAPDSTGRVYPSQNRILWYPLKNALLAGKVIAENKDSVGVNSFASGFESRSKGKYSQALGYKAIARGDYSTAIGKNALANNINSFAFGDSARATNAEGYAIGRGAVASGYRSFAFGSAGIDSTGKVTDVARASGDYSFAIGQGSRAMAKGSFAMGLADTVNGDYSIALGYGNRTNRPYSIALGIGNRTTGIFASSSIGYYNTATGPFSIAMGNSSYAGGEQAITIGTQCLSSGYYSIAMGKSTTSGSWMSTAMGSSTNASGMSSTAMGNSTSASGFGSTSTGSNTTASGYYTLSAGYYTTARAYASAAFGSYNIISGSSGSWIATDPLFVIGNGTSTTPNNALTVLKNGNLGIGVTSPARMLDIVTNNSSTQDMMIHFGEHANEGGYLGSFVPSDLVMSGGADFVAGAWIARDIATSSLRLMNGYTYFYNNAGLTTGNSFTPANTMTIASNGNVGIGTISPSQKLEVNGNIQISSNGYGIWLRDETTGTNWQVHSHGDVLRMFNGSVETIVGTQTSSRRWKDNIKPLENILEKINQLQGVTFAWKAGHGKGGNDLGFIAEEVGKVFPELVTYEKNGVDAAALNYPVMSAIAIEGIKELSKQNQSMKEQIASTKQENEQLRSELDELKALVNTLVANQTGQGNK